MNKRQKSKVAALALLVAQTSPMQAALPPSGEEGTMFLSREKSVESCAESLRNVYRQFEAASGLDQAVGARDFDGILFELKKYYGNVLIALEGTKENCEPPGKFSPCGSHQKKMANSMAQAKREVSQATRVANDPNDQSIEADKAIVRHLRRSKNLASEGREALIYYDVCMFGE